MSGHEPPKLPLTHEEIVAAARAESGRLLLRISRAASLLDCSRRYIYKLIERGELQFVHQGRSAFVTATSIKRYVERLRAAAGR